MPLKRTGATAGGLQARGEAQPIDVAFVLVPRFSLLPFVSALEPLRMANRLSGRALFRWQVIAEQAGPVLSGNGLTVVADRSLAQSGTPPNAVVVGGFDARIVTPRPLLAWLRRQARHGTRLGAIGTGSFHLAASGLLAGRRATVHWEYLPTFRAQFPDIDAVQSLFEIDDAVFTCAGGTAAMDLMLHLVALRMGHDLAAAIAAQFLHAPIRAPSEPQRVAARHRYGVSDVTVLRALEFMEARLAGKLDLAAIAREAGVTPRQLQRLFRRALATTPLAQLRALRLAAARRLLHAGGVSVQEAASETGFAAPAHFSRAFRRAFARSPREDSLVAIGQHAVVNGQARTGRRR